MEKVEKKRNPLALTGTIAVMWFAVLIFGINQLHYQVTHPDPWYVQWISKAAHYWIW